MDFKGECKNTGSFMKNVDEEEKENEKTWEHSWLLLMLVVQNCVED